ncbi:Hypothetical protein GLP15_506 [Giardia lamblia P15]|uniref:DinF protein n=1 Tax=Giardia intestinalis (strain P15) TaxID=658858 RepID=E1F6D7_GIAIA|nr:Hypothetical protein GLP15_506 [Giardia lamblia P15]
MSRVAANISSLFEDDFEECTAALPSFEEREPVSRRTITVEARRLIPPSAEVMQAEHPIFAHLQAEESVLHQIASSNHRVHFSGDVDYTTPSKRSILDERSANMHGLRNVSRRGPAYEYDSEAISLVNSMSSVTTRRSIRTLASHLYPSSAVAPIDHDSTSYPCTTTPASTTKSTKNTLNKHRARTPSSKTNNVVFHKVPLPTVRSSLPKRSYIKSKRVTGKSPFELIFLISYPMVLGYLSVSLYILFDYEVVIDTSGLANLTGLVYFTPLEQILITQLYLAFGSSAGTIMEKYYSRFRDNQKDTQSRVMSEKVVAYYFLFGLTLSLVISVIMVLFIDKLVRTFAANPANHYNYVASTLEYAYPILFFGPFIYFISSGLVPVLRTMNLGAYCLVRQLIGGAVFLVTTAILMIALQLANSGAAWGILLGELCTGLFFLFNFLEPFHLRIKILGTRLQLAFKDCHFSKKTTTTSSLVTVSTSDTRQTMRKSGPKSRVARPHTEAIPRIYLKAQRYGDFDRSLFCKFLIRGLTNYLGYLTPPLTALIGIIQHYKYGGKNAHQRQIATGLASRYLGTYQSPLTGLIAGITTVVDYYWSRKKYLKFQKAFYVGTLAMILFCVCYTIVFESLLPYFVQSYELESSYQKNIVKNGRIVFSFITFQTPFYMAVILAQILRQDKVSIFLTALRLTIGTAWNIIYPLATNSTDYMIHGIAIADILGGLSGLLYLFVKFNYVRRIIREEQLKHKTETIIHKCASITQLEKPPESIYISLLEKVDGTTYEIKKDSGLGESTEIGYLEEDIPATKTPPSMASCLSRMQSVQYLSQLEEQSMSVAHKITAVSAQHTNALSIIDIASTQDKLRKHRKPSF